MFMTSCYNNCNSLIHSSIADLRLMLDDKEIEYCRFAFAFPNEKKTLIEVKVGFERFHFGLGNS